VVLTRCREAHAFLRVGQALACRDAEGFGLGLRACPSVPLFIVVRVSRHPAAAGFAFLRPLLFGRRARPAGGFAATGAAGGMMGVSARGGEAGAPLAGCGAALARRFGSGRAPFLLADEFLDTFGFLGSSVPVGPHPASGQRRSKTGDGARFAD
jgi:hypothetical protein